MALDKKHPQQKSLDDSWVKVLDNPYLIAAAAEFQEKAIQALENKLKQFSSTEYYTQGVVSGLQGSIEIIKSLKA